MNKDSKPGHLTLSFADDAWDGKKIPRGQQCQRFGGKSPGTPRLSVKNIPAGANALVMEYSDLSYSPMNNGGHGKIGYRIAEGTSETVIPSVPGHTFDLPKDFFLVKAHASPSWDLAGAYLPPCSGGGGNTYQVKVKAVRQASPDAKDYELLASADLTLGKY